MLGQKVAHVEPEHFGQLGEVLWAGVTAAGFPRLHMAAIDSEHIANILQSEPACLAGDFDPFANTEGF